LHDLEIDQMDVKTAFLNAPLPDDSEVYITPLPGMNLPPGSVLKLRRALYGLKQAPRVWQDELSGSLKHLGFTKSTADDSLYIHGSIPHCFLLVYVDDVLVVGEAAVVKILKQKLSQIYEMTDLGPASKFVGLEIV